MPSPMQHHNGQDAEAVAAAEQCYQVSNTLTGNSLTALSHKAEHKNVKCVRSDGHVSLRQHTDGK